MSKYLIISGLNTVFAYGLFALFISFGWHYTLATFLPGVVSIYLGYISNKKIVFQAESKSKFDLIYYYLFYIGIYFVNIGIQTLMHFLGFSNDYMNGLVAVVITTIVTFSVNKWIFFSKGRSNDI